MMLLNKNKFLILKEYTKGLDNKIYGRDLAKRLRMNQKTTSNTLIQLEKENILRSKREGKNKYYYLNKHYPYIKEIVIIIEIQKKIDFLEKYKKQKELFRKIEEISDGILVVFGSYANFTSNEKSDIDIFIIGEIKNVENLEELYNIKINIIKSDIKRFDKSQTIIKEIIKNHTILKNEENFIDLIW